VSTPSPTVIRECPECRRELPLGEMACSACHTLIYKEQLAAATRDAQSLETEGRLAEAREVWNRALMLLPYDSTQAQWVREHLQTLGAAASAAKVSSPSFAGPRISSPAQQHPWVKRLGPVAPLALVLLKAKGLVLVLFKLKFLFSFVAFLWLYAAMFGWRYGVGIAVSILVHELGHFIDVKRRGLPAEMPVFLPGLGAYVKWNALGVTKQQRAQVSLAGPLAGWIAAAVCFLIYTYTHEPVWAAIARSGAMLNIVNLIPVWILDGSKAMESLGMVERVALLTLTVVVGAYTWEPIYILVALGIVFRLFTKDKPEHEDWSSWFYYAAVLAALGVVLHLTPAVTSRTLMR
jgi:Zn-dependent protease